MSIYYRHSKGFSLIELLIAMVIMSILAVTAYPSYRHHIVKTRRSEAQIALMALALQMENYYSDYHTYKGATLASLSIDDKTEHGFYELEIVPSELTTTTFLLKATALETQNENDPECHTLTLDQAGRKNSTGSVTPNECWK